MKIEFLNRGLANQAFQYIFAKYYELSHPRKYFYTTQISINKAFLLRLIYYGIHII